jgi:hypothetical protein
MKPGPANITEIILSEMALDAPPEPLEDVIHPLFRKNFYEIPTIQ